VTKAPSNHSAEKIKPITISSTRYEHHKKPLINWSAKWHLHEINI